MVKRIISMLSALAMASTLIQGAAAAYTEPSKSGLYNTVFSQDFESLADGYNIVPSTDETYDANQNIESTAYGGANLTVQAEKNNKALKWERTGNSTVKPILTKTFSDISSGKSVYSFKFRLYEGYSQLKLDIGNTSDNDYITIEFEEVGRYSTNIIASDTGSKQKFTAKRNYVSDYGRLDAVVDSDARTYDVYIDGKKLNTKALSYYAKYVEKNEDGSYKQNRNINRVKIRQNVDYASSGSFYLDDIYIGRENPCDINNPRTNGKYSGVYYNDFEVADADAGKVSESKDTVISVSGDSENHYVKFDKKAKTSTEVSKVEFEFPEQSEQIQIYSAKFKFTPGTMWMYIGLGNSGWDSFALTRITSVTENNISLFISNGIYDVSADFVNEWGRIDVIVDKSEKTFDVYVNGKKISSSTYDTSRNIDRMVIYDNGAGTDAGTYLADEIYVGVPVSEKYISKSRGGEYEAVIDQDFETLESGYNWKNIDGIGYSSNQIFGNYTSVDNVSYTVADDETNALCINKSGAASGSSSTYASFDAITGGEVLFSSSIKIPVSYPQLNLEIGDPVKGNKFITINISEVSDKSFKAAGFTVNKDIKNNYVCIETVISPKTGEYDIYADGEKINTDKLTYSESYIGRGIVGAGIRQNSEYASAGCVYIDNFYVGVKTLPITYDMILNGQNKAFVTKKLNLSDTYDINGETVNVVWSSSDESVISKDGTVNILPYDKCVTLTAADENGAVKSFRVNVPANGQSLYYNDFEGYFDGDSIENSYGWTKNSTNSGVNYTVDAEPVNRDDHVLKVERFITKKNDKWYTKDGTEIENQTGPSAGDYALYSLGEESISTGKVQLSARVMFNNVENQQFGMYIKGLASDSFSENNLLIFSAKRGIISLIDGNVGEMVVGAAAAKRWYDISIVIDTDAKEYTIFFGDKSQSGTYKGNTNLITDVGFLSVRTQDSGASYSSEWYVDDFSIKKIAMTDSEAVKYAASKLTVPSELTGDITLPLNGEEGTSVSWSSNDSSVISDSGVVTFSKEDKTAVLTATVTKGSETAVREFSVKVLARDEYDIRGINVLSGEENGNILTGGGTVTAVRIGRYINTSNKPSLITALYENNRLSEVSVQTLEELPLKNISEVALEKPISLPENIENAEVRVMIWGENLLPLCNIFTSNMPETSLFIVGDSIASYYGEEAYPQTGWGQVIGTRFNSYVTVKNKAKGGRSTRTYLDNTDDPVYWGTFENEIKPGDYVLVSLGINDSGAVKDRYTTIEQFEENYRRFAALIREKGANPIFASPIVCPYSSPITKTFGDRADSVKKIAAEENVPFLDVNGYLYDEFTNINDAEAVRENYFLYKLVEQGYITEAQRANHVNTGIKDNGYDFTHLSVKGANHVADVTAELLKNVGCDLAKYLNK